MRIVKYSTSEAKETKHDWKENVVLNVYNELMLREIFIFTLEINRYILIKVD